MLYIFDKNEIHFIWKAVYKVAMQLFPSCETKLFPFILLEKNKFIISQYIKQGFQDATL